MTIMKDYDPSGGSYGSGYRKLGTEQPFVTATERLRKAELAYPNLRLYVREKNVWRGLNKQAKYDLAFMTASMSKELEDSLEGDLSPENLCCDGEASPAYVRRRSSYLSDVKAELKKFKETL